MGQLPDYHDVIEHPMDFSTVRKKLARNAYRSFEQFEVRLLGFGRICRY
jgi:bromodomain-containing protein 9